MLASKGRTFHRFGSQSLGGGPDHPSHRSSRQMPEEIWHMSKLKTIWTEPIIQTRPFRSFAGIEAAKTEIKVVTFQTVNTSSNDEAVTSITSKPSTRIYTDSHNDINICMNYKRVYVEYKKNMLYTNCKPKTIKFRHLYQTEFFQQ